MDPLVIKERSKETRVHSCGNAEGRSLTKGMGVQAQITFCRLLVWITDRQTHTHAHTHIHMHGCMVYIQTNEEKVT